jgi:hypothetical protein
MDAQRTDGIEELATRCALDYFDNDRFDLDGRQNQKLQEAL